MKILHIRHNQIDKELWDRIVDNAVCSLPYAYSWYLDVVCPGWEALVTPGYEYVMPLPLKRKYGIQYLIQPRWSQQLGVLSAEPPTAGIISSFVRKIPYIFYDFNINHQNCAAIRQCSVGLPSVLLSSLCRLRNNYIIDVSGGMQVVRSRYDENTKRSLDKAQKAGLEIDDIEIDEFVRLWKTVNSDKAEELHRKLPDLVYAVNARKMGLFYGAWREGVLMAAVFAIRTRDKVYFLAPVSTWQGKECCAMFLLLDYLVKEHCCRHNLIFDCEGSMLDGVARFYKGFGPVNQPYTSVSRGRSTRLVNAVHNSLRRLR